MKKYGQGEYFVLDQDVLKTHSEDEDKRRLHQEEYLLGYSDIYSRTSGILWQYCRAEPDLMCNNVQLVILLKKMLLLIRVKLNKDKR